MSALTAAPAAADRPFAPGSFWNKRLGAHPRLSARSETLVRNLVRQTRRFDTWVNTTQYSTPVYVVPRNQRRFAVQVDTPSSMYTNAADAAKLSSQLSSVPIPLNARPANVTDQHIVIWQPSTDTMWELWIAHQNLRDGCPWGNGLKGVWHAAWGARINNVSTHRGRNPAPFGATASGLPLMGGLIRTSELRNKRINHALSMDLPLVRKDRFVWPATRSDGNSRARIAIPEGTRFRLDPEVRLGRLGLSPATLTIARAVKRYGLVITDRGGAVEFEAEEPRGASNPYPSIFGEGWQGYTLKGFPWRRLQALAPRR